MFKPKLKKYLSILFISIFIFPVSVFAKDTLPSELTKILNKYKLPKESLSVYIKEINAIDPLLAYKINEPRNPASVMKLVTTLAGLELLGPNHQWKTHFYADGEIQDGTLSGNLVIEGGGDPFFVRESFWHALHSIQEKGIKNITGDLIIDNSLYAQEKGDPGDFDKRPYRAYNAFPDAALVNFSAQQFVMIPYINRLHIYADPPSSTLTIRNKVKLTNGKCRGLSALGMKVSDNGAETIVEFNGKYPRRCGERNMLRSVSKNTEFTFGVFKALWESIGGTINGSLKIGLLPPDSKLVHVSTSKPLREIIQYINKHSNNVMARQLMLTIGKEINGKPGTKQTALLAIQDWFKQIGIQSKELVVENGAGLSRTARISAITLARLLEHGYRSPFRPEYLSSLPIAGIDGTMRKRLNGNIPAGSMRIKTGLLNNVRSMAGYVTAKSGKEYIVVSLQNYKGIQNWTGTQVQDVMLKWLYNNH